MLCFACCAATSRNPHKPQCFCVKPKYARAATRTARQLNQNEMLKLLISTFHPRMIRVVDGLSMGAQTERAMICKAIG